MEEKKVNWYKWRSFRKRKSCSLVYTVVRTRSNAIKTLSNRMPDAIALATKIRRPLLGLLPEALKSFEHSILFSSVPVPAPRLASSPIFSLFCISNIFLPSPFFEIWIDPIVVVSSLAFSTVRLRLNAIVERCKIDSIRSFIKDKFVWKFFKK